MLSVSVIIPTWNRADLVRSALSNLRQQTAIPKEILVVDNGSTDDTLDAALSYNARVITLPRNVGFAAAVNEGIRNATSEWLLILNNDVELEPHWLTFALDAAINNSASFVTGKLFQARAPARLDGTWDLVSRAGCAWRCGWNAMDGPQWSNQKHIQITSLTAALFHRSVFDQIGLLDTAYQSYYEDVDLGLRCAAAGIRGIYEPEARAVHLGSSTLGGDSRMTYLVARNQVLLAGKFKLLKTERWRVIVGQLAAVIPSIRKRHLMAAIRGKIDGWKLAKSVGSLDVDFAKLHRILEDQERELLAYQKMSGFDLSWRLYFRLTGR